MLSRRNFLAAAAATALPLPCPGPAVRGRESRAQPIKSSPDVVIYEGRYPGWPWITAGRDGILFCVFREGTVHDYSADGRVMLTRSRDQGATWSNARAILDAPEIDDRNTAIVELAGGELLVTYNTYTAEKESLAMTARSSDLARTWSDPSPVGEPNTRTKSAAVVLRDGSLLLPYYIAPGNGAVAARSSDKGDTWTTVRVPDAEGFVGDEWDVLEIEPGRLIGILRNSHATQDGTFWKTESRDGARSWDVPRATNVRSLRHASPAQLVSQGGRPTMIYSDRRMVSVSAVRTNDPEYLEWDVDHRLPCYLYNADESPIADGSYPVSAPIGERRRLIVDYEIREGSQRIAGYVVEFPEAW